MSTNFYAIFKVDDEVKQQIKDKIDANDFKGAQELFPITEVHLGKRSCGWKFLFNHNDWKYYKDLKSLKKFIKEHEIKDEYGKTITPEEFWQDVKDFESGIDGKEYYTNWQKHNKGLDGVARPYTWIPDNYGNEYHFGLRFSTCTDFC